MLDTKSVRLLFAGTWVATSDPSAIGIGLSASRQRRILRWDEPVDRERDDVASTSCRLAQLPFQPIFMRPSYNPTAHWRWPIGPGGLPPSSTAPAASEHRDDGGTYTESPWPRRTVPALRSASGGNVPAAMSPQEPAYGSGKPVSRSALLPPTRSIEPWTTEEWVIGYNNPTSSVQDTVGSLLMGSYGRYWGDARFGEEGQPWMPVPFDSNQGWPFDTTGHGT